MLGFTESIEYGIDLAVRNPFTVYTPGVYPQAMFDLLNNGWENIYSMDAKQFWKEQLTAVP